MNDTQEIWKEIPGWEGYYSISSLGRAKSHKRIITEKKSSLKTQIKYEIPEKILNPNIDKIGRHRISLSKNSKITTRFIHTLVLMTFVGKRAADKECCHKDGNPGNNKLDNLYYGTRSENIADAKKHGTFPMGENRPGAILNNQKAKSIYDRAKHGCNIQLLADEFGVKRATINQILRGETWVYATGGVPLKRTSRRFPFLTEQEKSIVLDETKSYREIAKLLSSERHVVSKWRKKLKTIP